MFGVMAFVFSSKRYVWGSPAFLGMTECPPAMGRNGWIPWFALLVNTAFALPIKLSLSQPMSFLTVTPPILFPLPTGEEWESSCVVLTWWLGLIHSTGVQKKSCFSSLKPCSYPREGSSFLCLALVCILCYFSKLSTLFKFVLEQIRTPKLIHEDLRHFNYGVLFWVI